MNIKDKIQIIIKLVVRDITNFFPYFFLLYVFIFIMSFFFLLWQSFWDKSLLHFSLIIFGLVYIFSKIKFSCINKFNFENNKKQWIQTSKEIVSKIRWNSFSESFYKIKLFIRTLFNYENLSYFLKKIFLTIRRFIFWLCYWIIFLDFKILIFCWKTLKSLWNKIKTGYFISWIGGFALFFITLSPFLLVFEKVNLAEKSAVYAYYFLIISLILIIIRNSFNKIPQNKEINK